MTKVKECVRPEVSSGFRFKEQDVAQPEPQQRLGEGLGLGAPPSYETYFCYGIALKLVTYNADIVCASCFNFSFTPEALKPHVFICVLLFDIQKLKNHKVLITKTYPLP